MLSLNVSDGILTACVYGLCIAPVLLFSKVFKICDKLLLSNLSDMSFEPCSLTLIESYLSNSSQKKLSYKKKTALAL